MNQLEQHILKGAIEAHKQYSDMTGEWLYHGPESFLQVVLAQELARTGHLIYIDMSIRRILREIGREAGRPAKFELQRPDISVWHRNNETLRAAIEIKRTANFDFVRSDANKIERYLWSERAARTGYILVYTIYNKDKPLQKRFEHWKAKLGEKWRLVGTYIDQDEDDSDWIWGVVLLRFSRDRNPAKPIRGRTAVAIPVSSAGSP
jgi:hypothetical protein